MDRIGDARNLKQNLKYNLQTKCFNRTGRNISRFVTKAFIFIPKQPNNKKLNFLEVKVQFLEYIFYELLLTNTEYRNRVCRELMY